jgi:hypothetical protein
VEELSLYLIFYNIFDKMSEVLGTKLQVKNSLWTRQKSIKTFSVECLHNFCGDFSWWSLDFSSFEFSLLENFF